MCNQFRVMIVSPPAVLFLVFVGVSLVMAGGASSTGRTPRDEALDQAAAAHNDSQADQRRVTQSDYPSSSHRDHNVTRGINVSDLSPVMQPTRAPSGPPKRHRDKSNARRPKANRDRSLAGGLAHRRANHSSLPVDSSRTAQRTPWGEESSSSVQQPLPLPDAAVSTRVSHPKPADVQVGCKELRSKRYISDGFCRSIKPIKEAVCSGHCLPIRNLPWYAEYVKVWARTKILDWRCVDGKTRKRKVRLLCDNGDTRTYIVKVVKNCRCKRYFRYQNDSSSSRYISRKGRRKNPRKNESNRRRRRRGLEGEL